MNPHPPKPPTARAANHGPHPSLSLPEPLRGAQPGTWAHNTIVVDGEDQSRIRVLSENDFPPEATSNVERLIEEIPAAPIRPLTDTTAPHAAGWKTYMAPHLGQNWLQVPWFLAEFYFYHRLLEASGYFKPGPTARLDPFARQKERGLHTSLAAIDALSNAVSHYLTPPLRPRDAVHALLTASLWGNRADLSIWPAGEGGHAPPVDSTAQEQSFLLVNHAAAVTQRLLDAAAPHRVDVLIDNAGFELVSDLALADYLLSSGTLLAVHFHLKAQPTFVSDAMPKDVRAAVQFLAAAANPHTRALGQRLQRHLSRGRLRLREHLFWISPLAGWQMPHSLRQTLSQARLVISKGDAHYRRLLGDRRWPFTTPFADIADYVPAPLAALRTLKSELAAGLQATQIAALNQQHPHWLTNGRWGVIQFVEPTQTQP
ncbi:MAG: damage-control phosphatase ARMT1 family protein [Anaerolineae bacterium]